MDYFKGSSSAKKILQLKTPERGNLRMKCLLVVYSYHHNNTQKIAEVFAKVLDAEIVTPQQADPKQTSTSTT